MRTVLGQLFELQALRVEIRDIKANQEAEEKLLETERALMAQKLDLERKATELAKQETALKERELKLSQDQVEFYSSSLKVCQSNKRTSGWCKVAKIFTLGLARCK